MKNNAWYARTARTGAQATGRATAFVAAVALILGWLVTGPIFHYSDTWQLVINTATTIITFLMVFLIQHTQNRDTQAIQIKLDELLRAIENANVALADLETLDDDELDRLTKRYEELAGHARKRMRERR